MVRRKRIYGGQQYAWETEKCMKIAVFWVVAPCSLVEVYQRFRGPCCLHHQGASSLTAVRTSNPTEKCMHNFGQNLKGIYHIEDIELERRMILKFMLET
jgi:hypothetical protein